MLTERIVKCSNCFTFPHADDGTLLSVSESELASISVSFSTVSPSSSTTSAIAVEVDAETSDAVEVNADTSVGAVKVKNKQIVPQPEATNM